MKITPSFMKLKAFQTCAVFLPEVTVVVLLILIGELSNTLVMGIEDSIQLQGGNDGAETKQDTVAAEIKSTTEGICPNNGNFIEIHSCRPCNNLDMKLKEECSKTGYFRILRCDGTNAEITRSCSNSIKSFWLFEFFMFLMGVAGGVVVLIRRRQLDRIAIQKIRKQIDSSI